MCQFNGSPARLVALVAAVIGLSACSQSHLRLQPDFGSAVRQDVDAQIADPDARYLGTPAPGSNGARVELAQKRYEQDLVIPPTSVTASSDGVCGEVAQQNGSNTTAPALGAGPMRYVKARRLLV